MAKSQGEWRADGVQAELHVWVGGFHIFDTATTATLSRTAHVVCDNYATHKTPAVRQWLLKHPRFHIHFTPTGSSWINQVERWFGYLTDQKIRRGAHKSVRALEVDIRDWIGRWNKDPRPFTWTKTAEEILNSLADYLAKVGAGQPKTGQELPATFPTQDTRSLVH